MKPIFFIFLFVFYTFPSEAQLRYPVQGTFKNKSAQGMAIYRDFAFLINNGGLCRQFNLKTGKVNSEFNLASAEESPHANNACFGVETLGDNPFPVIYISECKKDGYRCFVENIINGNSRLVQTIQAYKNGKVEHVYSWVVDKKEKMLYTITRGAEELDSVGNVCNTITQYRLPKLDEGSFITFTEKDIIDSFNIYFPNIVQGSKIRERYLYQVTGFQQSWSHRKDASREILVIDLKKRKLVKKINLNYLTTNEPEDIDFYRDKCLLYCGQEGGIYEVKLK